MKNKPYKLTEADIEEIELSLDDTGGMLIKESELAYWIAEHVNRDRINRKKSKNLFQKMIDFFLPT